MSRIVLGKHPDTMVRLSIDQKYTHNTTYVVGSPDQGKSTFLGNLAEQFHNAGEGVLVLDIKGDLAKDIAKRTARPEDTIYVKMGEADYGHGNKRYWTINPFHGHLTSPARTAETKRSVVESFERMGLAQLDTMANIRHTLSIATDLALCLDDPTYLDLYCIIVDKDYREDIIRKNPQLDPITKREWLDLGKADHKTMTPREQRQITRTSRNRLYTLLNDPSARLTACKYKPKLKLRQWLDDGKMVLIDLGQPLQHDAGVDLGNMIMAQLLTDIYQRPEGTRERTWRIVVDEFHQFVGNSFATIMTDLRYLNAFLVIAHQDRGQLYKPELAPLRSAIGHAGLVARFSQSLEDRVAIASLYGIEAVDDYFTLKQHQARMTYYSRLEGNKKTETVMLLNWWCEPCETQLEELKKKAQGMTQHRDTLESHFTTRYVPLLDADAFRDSVDGNDHNQAQPQVRGKQKQTGQATQLPLGEASDAPRPGRRGPTRAVDQSAVAPSLLPKPTQD